MEFVKTRGLAAGALLFLFMIGFTGCNDDNGLTSITLTDREDSNIKMVYRGEVTSEYSFSLQGGDGYYSVRSDNEEVVAAEMITSNLHLMPTGIGETIVTVTDNSQNTLVLNVQVDYETLSLVIAHNDVSVTGDDLTGNEVKAIRELQLAQIPVNVGGGYKFIYTDSPNGKGIAIVYPETFGADGIETTFEYRNFEGIHGLTTASWGYELTIDNEKRLFVIGRYVPSGKSSRAEVYIPMALMEDVTGKVQTEYPKAELVYTSQLIERKVH